MNFLNATETTAELLSLAHSVQGSLEKALGRKFSLWSQTEGCLPIPHNGTAFLDGLDLLETLGSIVGRGPFVEDARTSPLPCGRHLLIVPVQQPLRARLLLIGLVNADAASLAGTLADSVVRSHRLSCQLDNVTRQSERYVQQITSNFEELAWLRLLTQHFEICSSQDGLAGVAQATLPALREIIEAQTIFLFGMPPVDNRDGVASNDCQLLFVDGDQTISESAARQLLASLGTSCLQQSIVWNAPPHASQVTDRDAIRNYILTPVTKSQEQHGWLLAINKLSSLEGLDRFDPESIDRNLIEFGTTEAGLLRTMAVMLATHGKNVELLKEKEALLVGVIRSMVNTIDAKDAYTHGHSDRVALMSKRFAEQLGQSALECERAYMGGLLHDIGKIGVPDAVLGKADKLTDDEYALMKLHPGIGVEILRHLEPFRYVLPGVLHHHEAFNGRGYPAGLAGEQIPLLGRIIAVADSYDAMTSTRTYRQGMPTQKAENILREGAGSQWDPRIIEAFFTTLPDVYAICGLAPAEATSPPRELADCCER